MSGRRGQEVTFSGRLATAIVGTVAVALLLAGWLHGRAEREGPGIEVARLAYTQAVHSAREVERTRGPSGAPSAATQEYLSRAAADLDASLVLFLEADTPLAVGHGPSLHALLARLKELEDAPGTLDDSGQQPWIPTFGDNLAASRFPHLNGRPVRVQTTFPFAVEAPVGSNMTLRFIPLSLQPLDGSGFGSSLIAVFILMSLVGAFVALRVARPVEATAQAFERMASGDLVVAAPRTGIRELSWIGRAAERVGARVRESAAQQRQVLVRIGSLLVTPVEQLRDEVGGLDLAALPPTTRGPINSIRARIDSLNGTVGSLWLWNQLEENAIALQPAEVELHPLVAELIELFRDRAPGLDVRLVVPDEMDDQVTIDAELIGRALTALLENAHAHGAGPVTVTLTRGPTKLEVTVHDAGAGVDYEQLAAVLEPFTQGSEATEPGLGLGLRISRLISALHGGGLTARNATEGGFQVSFWLPASPIRISPIDRSLIESVDWAHDTGELPAAPPEVEDLIAMAPSGPVEPEEEGDEIAPLTPVAAEEIEDDSSYEPF